MQQVEKKIVLCNKNTTSRANDSHTTHKMGEKYTECNRKKIVQMIFMNYISIIYIIKQPNGSIRWLYSELILPGYRLATRIHTFQCFIWYVPLFHPCFWCVLCQSALSCVFLGFFRECSYANVLLCVCFHARTTHFTFTLRLLKFPKKQLNSGSKDQNLFIGWICDSLNQSGHRGWD